MVLASLASLGLLAWCHIWCHFGWTPAGGRLEGVRPQKNAEVGTLLSSEVESLHRVLVPVCVLQAQELRCRGGASSSSFVLREVSY